MTRLLPLALLFGLAGCGLFDAFDADRGSFSATVRGDQRFDLDGSAYYVLVQDDPLTTGIILTDTDLPTIEFRFEGGSVRGTLYHIPADASATFELDRYDGAPYRASGGTVEILRVSDTEAAGEFSFTATRGAESITVEGEFVAEREAE
ncbi:hypothetical protein [Rubricoccus marinus]|uniref:Lipoprotein n=1 Tax=Rubricoccus marinus TaxID=716817 RepID=A0A259TUX3_9BACT|nr:hypothetical protein [Rubricoccus marinus]OZC01565.1 hypothetical protein BSZ36_00330 [Rubricoccus marinus]